MRTLLGLALGGTATRDEPLLKLHFILVHQKELSQQDVGLWGGSEAERKTGKVTINRLFSSTRILVKIEGRGTGQV